MSGKPTVDKLVAENAARIKRKIEMLDVKRKKTLVVLFFFFFSSYFLGPAQEQESDDCFGVSV